MGGICADDRDRKRDRNARTRIEMHGKEEEKRGV